uniref:Uncharacterized protein n=1 Tax=Oryza punctata TaxID=4537 RepID=A0A0E0JX92_ORYPU
MAAPPPLKTRWATATRSWPAQARRWRFPRPGVVFRGEVIWNAAFKRVDAQVQSRLAMELRLLMQGGIEPPRPLELMLSAMTRSWVCVLLHETPCQLQKFWDVLVHELKAPASLSVSVSSLIANGREHEMMKIARSGMSFGQGANRRIILLLVLWLAFAYGIFIAGSGSD